MYLVSSTVLEEELAEAPVAMDAFPPVEPVALLAATSVPDVLPTVDAIEDSLSRVAGKLGRMAAEIRKLDAHFRKRLRQSEEALVEVEARYLSVTQTKAAEAPAQDSRALHGASLDHIYREIQRVEARIPEITREVAEMLADHSIELGRIARKNIEQGELKAYLKALHFAVGEQVGPPAALHKERLEKEALPYSRKQDISFCTAEVDILMHIQEIKGERTASGQIVARGSEPLGHPLGVHLIQHGQRIHSLNANQAGEFAFDCIPEGIVRIEFAGKDDKILAQVEIEADRQFHSHEG
jgi:hypothetical protein